MMKYCTTADIQILMHVSVVRTPPEWLHRCMADFVLKTHLTFVCEDVKFTEWSMIR